MGELSTLIAQHSKLMADMKELMQVRSELESLKLQVLQAELKLMDRELKLLQASPMKKKESQHSARRKPRKPEGPPKNTNTDSSGLWNWSVQ